MGGGGECGVGMIDYEFGVFMRHLLNILLK